MDTISLIFWGSYLIITILSLFFVIYNYLTKYKIFFGQNKGPQKRLYTKFEVFLKISISLVPILNICELCIAIFEPMDLVYMWGNIKTQELCRRSKLWSMLNSYSKITK